MHWCQLFFHNQGIYLNEYMQITKHQLFYHGRSCRIETSPLICSENQWTSFCIIRTYVMKDSRCSSSTCTKSLFLYVVTHNSFFSTWHFFHKYSQDSRWKGSYLLIFFLPISDASQKLRHQLGYCCRDLTSPHSWQSESNMKRLVLSL